MSEEQTSTELQPDDPIAGWQPFERFLKEKGTFRDGRWEFPRLSIKNNR